MILGNTFTDLVDIYKQQDGKGNIVPVIEMLHEMNPILDDAVAVECNKGTTHMHAIRTGLPTVTWGKLYQGIPQSKSQRAQVEDTTGFVEGLSTVDTRLLDISGNPGATRLGEAEGFLEAINQEVATKIFYGNSSADPEEFMGLSPRFDDLSAENGNNIIDAGGTGSDNTSIWFVTWGDNQCQLLYPKGTQAGVKREDMGKQRVTDGAGDAYYAMEEKFSWHVGMAVKDWRYVVRIANIDVSEALAGNVDLFTFMRKAYWKLQNRRQMMTGKRGGAHKICVYANRDMLEVLDALSTNAGASDSFVRLTPKEIQGQEIMTYRQFPLRETDALINAEARVT